LLPLKTAKVFPISKVLRLSTLYNIEVTEDGSFQFITDNNHVYLIYFLETLVPDSDGNIHTFLNLGFSRDGNHSCVPFTNKYDSKISGTIINLINEVFAKHDHRVLIYFCFGDDGYSRHRKITFAKWKRVLNHAVESHNATIRYEETEVFSCLMLVSDNPLKELILDAFEAYLKDFQ
jgi:hypothetical protein